MQDLKAPAQTGDFSATGRVLAGRYRVGALVRSGGMGAVYEGEHMATGRRVALKLVHRNAHALSELEDRFEREARIAGSVQSKHIVQVFDAGRDETLGPFMVMELLRGQDLEDRLARTGPLLPRAACEAVFQAARGLERAHAAKIAHRDLKPGNVFFVESDEEEDLLVKVLDFGIAKLCDNSSRSNPPNPSNPSNRKLTHTGTAVGTPQYMSPEQARGREDVDTRTDIYSLGAVLYEMLVGRSHVPDLPSYNDLLIHVATERAPRVSDSVRDIDPRIDRLVAEMLVADRRDRIQTMRRVREKLAPILGGAARMGSIADASGSFRSRSEPPFMEEPLSSARIHPIAAATMVTANSARESENEEDESEEVIFFDRESASAARAALPIETTPDSGEEVELFDRASLHLSTAMDRTSSAAHAMEKSLSSLPPWVFRSEPVPHASLAPPAAAVTLGHGAPRSTQTRARSPRAFFAAASAVAVFVTLGFVQFGTSSEDGQRAAGAPAPATTQAATVASPGMPSPSATVSADSDAGDAGTPTDAP